MNKWKGIPLIIFIVLVSMVVSGCSGQSKSSLSQAQKQTSNESTPNKAGSTLATNGIPFSYAFTGFVVVNDVQKDLPIGTELINSESAWNKFENKYLYYDMPYSEYYAEPIDFNKQSVIYFSMLDAKADVNATARQINNIIIENNQLAVNAEPIDNLHIIVVNREGAGHRYVIVVTVDKNSLPSNFLTKETYFSYEDNSISP